MGGLPIEVTLCHWVARRQWCAMGRGRRGRRGDIGVRRFGPAACGTTRGPSCRRRQQAKRPGAPVCLLAPAPLRRSRGGGRVGARAPHRCTRQMRHTGPRARTLRRCAADSLGARLRRAARGRALVALWRRASSSSARFFQQRALAARVHAPAIVAPCARPCRAPLAADAPVRARAPASQPASASSAPPRSACVCVVDDAVPCCQNKSKELAPIETISRPACVSLHLAPPLCPPASAIVRARNWRIIAPQAPLYCARKLTESALPTGRADWLEPRATANQAEASKSQRRASPISYRPSVR